MKILIAAGIYPPEVGGPALYAEGVTNALRKMGHEPVVVLFGDLRKYPSGVRHALYAIRLYRASREAAAIYAFDTYSVGVPAALIARLSHIPLVIRIGGDFVWESYIERTKDSVPLPDFYRTHKHWNIKERISFRLVCWMLRKAQLAFNTPWLLEIWREPYKVSTSRAHIVENVIGERLPPLGTDNTIVLYGRSIALKNSEAFRRAFVKAQKKGIKLELEEGMVPHEKLVERIRSAYAVAVPSVSDVAPNLVLDAIRCGKPFLLTKYSGYAKRFGELGVIVDPLDEADMEKGIKRLADPDEYAHLVQKISNFKEVRTYDDVARELLALT